MLDVLTIELYLLSKPGTPKCHYLEKSCIISGRIQS